MKFSGFGSTGSPITSAPSSPPTPFVSESPTAEVILTCGSVVSGSTVGAPQAEASFCGTSTGSGGAKWYKLVGASGSVTVSTCSGNTSYDSKLSVFSNNKSTCEGGNDDTCGLQSSVTFDADVNTEYQVLVQ